MSYIFKKMSYQRFLIFSFSALSSWNFVNIIFYAVENNKDKTINDSNICLLFDLLWCQKSIS